jgi:Transglutaminase elicitor
MDRCLRWTWVSSLVVGALASSGCGTPPAPPAEEVVGEVGDADQIAAYEQPEALVGGASRRLADIIRPADVGREFTVPSFRVPYADTYWSFVLGGTDIRWNARAPDPRSPIEKYMTLVDPLATVQAELWEYIHHGPGKPGVMTWEGHCPGWAAAAMSNAPIRHPVLAAADGRGGIMPCREGQLGCVRFEIGDVNALMAEVYFDGPASIIGTTCGLQPFEVARDLNGRVLQPGCDGVNAGSFLVSVVTLLRRYHVPFGIDVQKPASTGEIWNQPAYGYHIYDFRPIGVQAAANLVAHGTSLGPETFYRWNPAARGFAFVDLGLEFVGEAGPNLLVVPGTRSSYELRVAAVIELDLPATDPRASILGGEYLDLPSSHANRLTVTPYLWLSRGTGPELLPLDVDGFHHNPYIRPSLVKQLIALGHT